MVVVMFVQKCHNSKHNLAQLYRALTFFFWAQLALIGQYVPSQWLARKHKIWLVESRVGARKHMLEIFVWDFQLVNIF